MAEAKTLKQHFQELGWFNSLSEEDQNAVIKKAKEWLQQKRQEYCTTSGFQNLTEIKTIDKLLEEFEEGEG